MRHAVVVAALAALAACDNSPEVRAENASVAEVESRVAAAGGSERFVRPGRWQSDVVIENIAIPGMPPEAAARMKETMAEVRTQHSCLTPEDVKRPREDFFAGGNANCRYDRFTMAGGKIDAVMKCSAGDTTQTMTMAGDYSPDAYAMRMEMAHSGNGGRPGMTMAMRVNAKRVGECTGKEG